jgi:hypothetical protein
MRERVECLTLMMFLGRLELRELDQIKRKAGVSRDTTADTLFVTGVTRTPELDFELERRERDRPRSGGSKSYLLCIATAVTEDAGELGCQWLHAYPVQVFS